MKLWTDAIYHSLLVLQLTRCKIEVWVKQSSTFCSWKTYFQFYPLNLRLTLADSFSALLGDPHTSLRSKVYTSCDSGPFWTADWCCSSNWLLIYPSEYVGISWTLPTVVCSILMEKFTSLWRDFVQTTSKTSWCQFAKVTAKHMLIL